MTVVLNYKHDMFIKSKYFVISDSLLWTSALLNAAYIEQAHY